MAVPRNVSGLMLHFRIDFRGPSLLVWGYDGELSATNSPPLEKLFLEIQREKRR